MLSQYLIYSENPCFLQPNLKKIKLLLLKMQIVFDKHYLLNNFQDLRILQINILFIHGLSNESCKHISKIISNDYGPITKITFQNIHANFHSAFVTFTGYFQASKALLALNNSHNDQKRILRVYYGSTKFCPNFLRNQDCQIQDCNYAHYYLPWLTFFKKDLKSVDHSQIARYIIQQDSHNYHQQQINNSISNYSNNRTQNINQQNKAQKNFKYKTQLIKKQERSDDKHQIINSNKFDNCTQQIDWIDINKQIDGYLRESKQKELKMQKKTKIQQFLDDAEKKLLQLIFKYNYYL